ncbi:MAG: tripartite tricarboxylate transporter substrate binding protein [Betaproteobacteria bacterium]|jgi:tripartite-type tricarboxylate transporter receptor subunit TctC|nr:tripartite tricarboxylate transporter substrate binding protein [Betaproteobacteria bacterium]MBK6602223.1 tripartite tricarboxylate transporter substrate binding protein [Betaproteobacteria bacterium]MBK7079910.1 tripartite tricarboxylate transporter substrate binding protein [Betaproteobacteria bacterium]MBK8688540.1 tripartite tricarboxylate transporter substrate binding protein [Betaproteobacteria bacterium]
MQARSLRSLAVGLLFAVAAVPASAQWKPTKPITIIVPWAAGGSTDQVTRVAAAEIEKALNQKVVIVNQPGASGSIGTKNVVEAPKDGYTWAAGAAKDLGTYAVLGMLDTRIQDWALFLSVANVSTLSVNPATPYKTPTELIDAMKAKPGAISVATAGVNSSGHSAIEAISRAANVKYKHVTYDGGNPAVVATVAGETESTTQLTVEQAEMIRGKKLRPLAVIGDKPVELDGYGVIEPITKWMPGFKEPANYFGIFIPKGVPPEVIATVERIWAGEIAKSAALKSYATSRGAQFAPIAGADAMKAVMPAVQVNAWQAFDGGKAKVSPDTLGIPRP